jgi:predicted kinase
MIHLLCGPTAAGKTTFAGKLIEERQAVHFALDQLLAPISFPESPTPAFMAELIDQSQTYILQILQKAEDHLAHNRDVTLDIPTFRREHRDVVRGWAAGLKQPLTLYYFSANRTTRLERLRKRNVERGATYSYHVPEWLFDWVDQVFETPAPDEGAVLINTNQ